MKSFGKEHFRAIGDLAVSPLGLGTVKFGRNTDVKYPQPFQIPEPGALAALLDKSTDLGINLIDTAPAYGESEERLGRLMGANRPQWIISTKVGETYTDHSVYDFSTAATTSSIENSLHRLHTDYLDIVLVHCHSDDEQILHSTPIIRDLQNMKDRGLIRFIGASTSSIAGGLLALEEMDLVMVTYNPADQSQLPVIRTAGRLGKTVMIKKVFASGHTRNIIDSLKLAIKQPAVASIIIGTINETHLQENVQLAVDILNNPAA